MKSLQRPVIVLKFGGASLATVDRMALATHRISTAAQSHSVIVVVSALGHETDRLLGLMKTLNFDSTNPDADTVLASGEQIAAGLMSLALSQKGLPARAFLAHQMPIMTDGVFGDAQILSVGTARLRAAVQDGLIPVIAGFQGVDRENRLVTLGRGGSDTTAVAVAAAMQAELCEFYKDVDGIYSSDPKEDVNAIKFHTLTHQQMIDLAQHSPQILHTKAVRLAHTLGVRLHVRSAFDLSEGTFVLPSHEFQTTNLKRTYA